MPRTRQSTRRALLDGSLTRGGILRKPVLVKRIRANFAPNTADRVAFGNSPPEPSDSAPPRLPIGGTAVLFGSRSSAARGDLERLQRGSGASWRSGRTFRGLRGHPDFVNEFKPFCASRRQRSQLGRRRESRLDRFRSRSANSRRGSTGVPSRAGSSTTRRAACREDPEEDRACR